MPENVIAKEVFCTNRDSLFDGQEAPDERGGRRRLLATLMASIHSLVQEAAATSERPFVPRLERDGRVAYDRTAWAQRYFGRFPMLIQIIRALSPKFSYSEPVELFRAACAELELDRMDNFPDLTWRPEAPFRSRTMSNAECFNALHAIIRRDWASKGYKAKYQRRKRIIETRTKEYLQFATNCLGIPPRRSMVLRLDFYYRPEHQRHVTIRQINADFEHLYNNFRCNTLFEGLQGYITKLEYGVEKGLHMHVILIFDARHKNPIRHVYHAKEIGKYWVNVITKGRGTYWNCNDEAARYEVLGIRGVGPIEPKDWQTRENFLNRVVGYLCKEEQFIRPAGLNGVRLMRCGRPPTARSKSKVTAKRGWEDEASNDVEEFGMQLDEIAFGKTLNESSEAIAGRSPVGEDHDQRTSMAKNEPGSAARQDEPPSEHSCDPQ